MTVSIGGKRVLRVEVTENRVAAWTAMIEADSSSSLSGAQSLEIDGEVWAGTVVQSEVDAGRWKGLLVGGGGGLHRILPASHYYQPSVQVVLSDIARDSGEVLDPAISTSVLSTTFPRWARLAGDAHTAVRQLADELGMEWRITRSGGIWIGAETWPVVSAKCLTEEFSPELRRLTIAYTGQDERPVVQPGVTFDGRRVERVVTQVDGRKLRQEVYFDETKGQAGLFAAVTKRIREVIVPKLMLSRIYAGRVTSQAGDGSVSMLMDDALVGGDWKGPQQVPLVFGLPGVRIEAAPGARVRLFFDSGSPARPRAALWDQDAAVTSIQITAGTLKVVGDLEVTGTITATEVVAQGVSGPIALTTHVHSSFGTPPTAPPTPPTP